MRKDSLIVSYGNDPYRMGYGLMEYLKINSFVQKDKKIAIKPNLVVAKPSDSGATTSPGLVEGVISYLRDSGFSNITIMEGSWIGDSTKRAFEVCGYNKLSSKYSVPLVDLKTDSTVQFTHNGITIKICKAALDADFLINMPVLKAHCQTLMTCALKNLKGCIPDNEKRHFHTLGLHKPIAILNKFLRPALTIVDGIMGDLTFEEGGTPVRMDRIIAGVDPVLIDSYVASLMGYSVGEVEYIIEAEKLGVGSTDLSKAEVIELNKDNKPTFKFTPDNRVARLAKYINENQACSACYGSLIHALNRMDESHALGSVKQKLNIGQGFRGISSEGIGIGNCTSGFSTCVRGCPPKALDIVASLKE
jgi:Uncharacterized conserved protein